MQPRRGGDVIEAPNRRNGGVADMILADLARKLAEIDFAMLTTRTDGGAIAMRPMSNNGDVEYDGDSFYFSYENARSVADIEADPCVGLTFQGVGSPTGRPPLFVAVQGRAEVIRDRAMFRKHWVPDLERWFEDGVETEGMVLLKVHADRLHYWNGGEEGEIVP